MISLVFVFLDAVSVTIQPLMADHSSKRGLRWCGVDGTNAEIISTALTRLKGLLHGADGDSDDGIWA